MIEGVMNVDNPQDSIKEIIMRTRTDEEFKQRKAEHEEARRAKARSDPGLAANMRRYEKNNPQKISARKALAWAVKQGEVAKAERCALNSRECFGRIEAHHWRGYEWRNRFEVIWLCHKHHQMIEFGELTLSPNIRPILNFTQ